MFRYEKLPAAAARPDGGEVAEWARAAVAWALEAGVLQGDEAGYLHPGVPATRAETAQLFTNVLRAGILPAGSPPLSAH